MEQQKDIIQVKLSHIDNFNDESIVTYIFGTIDIQSERYLKALSIDGEDYSESCWIFQVVYDNINKAFNILNELLYVSNEGQFEHIDCFTDEEMQYIQTYITNNINSDIKKSS